MTCTNSGENMKLAILLKSILIFFLSTIFTPNAISAPSSLKIPSEMDKEIALLLKQYDIPGASLAVVSHGKIIWAKAYGFADIDTKRPVTTDTLFQAASITKSLTSTAVMKILAKYHIALDAPLNNYLKRWKIPANKYTKRHEVTVLTLLNHTAAISNPYPDGGYSYKDKLPTLTQLFLGKPPATNPPLTVIAVPGSQYNYCNGCYSILQMFLEDVTSTSYPELMRTLILQPAGMSNSYFDNHLFINSPNKVALPYNSDHQRFTQAPTTSPIYSTGYLWTTSRDLAKFIIAIQKSLNTSHGLLSQSQAHDLVTPSSTPTRGLGFFISDKNGDEQAKGKYFMHTGSNIGYLTMLMGSVDGKNGAAIMINISPEWNAKDYPQFEFIKDSLKLINRYYHWE